MCGAGDVQGALTHLSQLCASTSSSTNSTLRITLRMMDVVMAGIASKGRSKDAQLCLQLMSERGMTPSSSTLASLLRLEGRTGGQDIARVEHQWAAALRTGLVADPSAHEARVVASVQCAKRRPHGGMGGSRQAAPSADAVRAAQLALDEMVIEFKRVKHENNGAPNEWHRHLVTAFNSMLSAVASAGDSSYARRLVSHMKSLGLQLDSFTYNELLRVELMQTHSESLDQDVYAIMQDMKAQGVHANSHIYTTLLTARCRMGNLDGARQLISQAVKEGVLLGVPAFNVVIGAAEQAGKLESALKLRASMAAAGVRPSARTFCLLFSAVAKAARKVDKNAPNKNEELRDVKGTLQRVEQDLEESGVKHTSVSFSALLKAYEETQQIEAMAEAFEQPPPGVGVLNPSHHNHTIYPVLVLVFYYTCGIYHLVLVLYYICGIDIAWARKAMLNVTTHSTMPSHTSGF
jgi:pentatricopeptide repeat protein